VNPYDPKEIAQGFASLANMKKIDVQEIPSWETAAKEYLNIFEQNNHAQETGLTEL
jgi:hypothetical protein